MAEGRGSREVVAARTPSPVSVPATPAALLMQTLASGKGPTRAGVKAVSRQMIGRRERFLSQIWKTGLVSKYMDEWHQNLENGGTPSHAVRDQLHYLAKQAGLDPTFAQEPIDNLASQMFYGRGTTMKAPGDAGNPFLERMGHQVVSNVEGVPGGLISTGKAIGEDAGSALNMANPFGGGGTPSHHTTDLLKAMGTQVGNDVRHPGANPGNLAFDALGFAGGGAGTAAKVGEAGRVLAGAGELGDEGSLGARLGAAGKALVRKPAGAERSLNTGGFVSNFPGSDAPLTNFLQQRYDRVLDNPERFGKAQNAIKWLAEGKQGKEIDYQGRFGENYSKGLPNAVEEAGKRATDPMQSALRAIATGTPIEDRIAVAREGLQTATSKVERADHQSEIKLLQKAKSFVKEGPDGKPILNDIGHRTFADRLKRRPESLLPLQDLIRQASERDTALNVANKVFTPETAAERVHAEARVIGGEALKNPGSPIPGQMSLMPLSEDGIHRIPSVPRGGLRDSVGQLRGYRLGRPRPNPMATHEYTGALLKASNQSPDVAGAVAKSLRATERHNARLELRKSIEDSGVGKTFSKDTLPPIAQKLYQPMRTSKASVPAEVKQLMERQNSGESLSKRDLSKLDQAAFPNLEDLTAEDFKNVVFVPKRLLKRVTATPLRIDGSGPGYDALRLAAKAVRSGNQAERGAARFLGTPKYFLQWRPQNMAFNAVEQGVSGVRRSLGSARKTAEALSPVARARLDSVMEEGYVGNVMRSPTDLIQHASTGATKFFSKYTDLNERRSAFFHEAAQRGFDTVPKLEKMLTDPARKNDVYMAWRKAVANIGDYHLGPVGSTVAQHGVYPLSWFKVASNYSKHFVAEHPVKASVANQLGAEGHKEQVLALGHLLDYLSGLVPLGHRGINPIVANTAGVNPFSTPIDLMHMATGAGGASPLDQLLPVQGAVIRGLWAKQSPFGTAYKPGTSTGKILEDYLWNNQPSVTFAQRLLGDKTSKMYPMNKADAALQFIFGTAAPKPMDIAYEEKQHAKDQNAGLSKTQKLSAKAESDLQKVASSWAVLGHPLPKRSLNALRAAYSTQEAHGVWLANAQAKASAQDLTPSGKSLTPLAALKADYGFLVSQHRVSKANADKTLRAAAALPASEITSIRRQLNALFFGGDLISEFKQIPSQVGLK